MPDDTSSGQSILDRAYAGAVSVPLPDGAVAVVRRGSGPPVILLHGVPLSLVTWRNNIDELARVATVVAIDLRGFGRSAKPPGTYGLEAHARVVEQVMEALGFHAAAVVGSSYGAAVAITLAATAPARVARLVLVNPVCYPGGPHAAERAARIALVSSLVRTALRVSPVGKRMLAQGLAKSYADSRLATPELVDAYYRLLRQHEGERTFLATLRALRERDVEGLVPTLTAPTLIVWGAEDTVLPHQNAARMAREIANSELVLLEGVGHLPHEEAPERVNPLITRFVTGGGGERDSKKDVIREGAAQWH